MTEADPNPPAVPGPLAAAATLVGIPVAGAAVGLIAAIIAAPGSEAAAIIGALTLPVAFGVTLMTWRAMLGVWLAALLGRSALRSRGSQERFRDETIRSFASIREAGLGSLPFTWVFVPIGLASGFVAAILVSALSAGGAVTGGVLLMVAATGQGIVLRRLARAGRLPLPDE